MSEEKSSNKSLGGIGRALSTPSYRTYWFGQVVMVQGFWIHKIAAGWLMWEMTESPTWLGALGSAYLLPILILGPFGGAIADRFGYRRCAILMGSAGALTALATAILTWTSLISPLLLFVANLIQGLFFAFEFPARQSLFPNLVPRKDLSAAVALNATTFHSSAFTGPLIGGLLLQSSDSMMGVGAGFAANAFCTAWMASAIFRIPSPANLSVRIAAKKASGLASDLKAGLKYTLSHIDIRLFVLLSATTALLVRHYLDFLPGFADNVFGQGKTGLAALTAAAGIGALLVASILAARGKTKGLTNILVIAQTGAAIALIIFSNINNFNIGLVVLAIIGGLLVATSVCSQSLIQHTVDDEYRARVISINVSLAVGAPALSALVVGGLAEIFGLQAAITGSAILALIIFIPVGMILRKRRHEIEAEKT